MSRLAWHWWLRRKDACPDNPEPAAGRLAGEDRRHLLQSLSAVIGSGALAALSPAAEAKDASDLPPPKRVLTGRDAAGKSVFKSFEVTPRVVEIDATAVIPDGYRPKKSAKKPAKKK